MSDGEARPPEEGERGRRPAREGEGGSRSSGGDPPASETRGAEAAAAPSTTGIRVLLAAGAVIFAGMGLWGLFDADWLRSALGLDVPQASGFVALARLFGAVALTLGVAYGTAVVAPMRNRGLLVVCFVAPLITGIVTIVATARGEMGSVAGSAFGGLFIAYALIYFRLYPKPLRTLSPKGEEGEPSDGGAEGEPSKGAGSSPSEEERGSGAAPRDEGRPPQDPGSST